MERGDFLGFTFGNYSSDDLEIIRVSSSDRYEEQLQPEIKDRTAEVPGLNGEYYFGSDYGTRSFDIEFAFDHLTEVQFRQLRKAFGTKQIQPLVFDERPYKKYMAKLESPVELSYVCFDEPKRELDTEKDGVRVKSRTPITEEVDGETQVIGYTIEREPVIPYKYLDIKERIYKGEGKMTLVCYFPFAKSCFKVLPAEESDEWVISSGILSAEDYSAREIDVYNSDSGVIKVYNAGDIETGFRMYIPFQGSEAQMTLTYQYDITDNQTAILKFTLPAQGRKNGFDENSTDCGVFIDTNTNLIIGVASDSNNTYVISNNLYNDCIEAGYFFKLQPNDFNEESEIIVTNGNENIKIFYDYLYF